MVKYIVFSDPLRQEEIENFYEVCQLHRENYKGYPNVYHPLTFFSEPEYMWQCPSEMSQVYLGYPSYHVRYKQPAILPQNRDPASVMPPLPNRSLGGRYNKAPCKAFVR